MTPRSVRIGQRVHYHAVIGGPVTGTYEVAFGPWQIDSGHWVAKLKGKPGCVSVQALTPATEDPDHGF